MALTPGTVYIAYVGGAYTGAVASYNAVSGASINLALWSSTYVDPITSVPDSVLGLDVDATGRVFVAHAKPWDNPTIDVLDAAGSTLTTFQVALGGGQSLFSIIAAPDASGVYALMGGGYTDTIKKFDPAGTLLHTWDVSGCNAGADILFASPGGRPGLKADQSRIYTGVTDGLSQYDLGGSSCLAPLINGAGSSPTFGSIFALGDGTFYTTGNSGEPYDVTLVDASGTITSQLKGPNWAAFSESQTQGACYLAGSVLWLVYNFGAEVDAVDSTDPTIQLLGPLVPGTSPSITHVVFAPTATAVNRRPLSPLGTRIGSRQLHR